MELNMFFENKIPSPPDREGWGFVSDLRKPSDFHLHWSPPFSSAAGSLDLSKGVAPCFKFPDPSGVLETANADLVNFLKAGNIYCCDGIPITCSHTDVQETESFRLEVAKKGITILSGDAEGIRRGIYCLEEMLLGVKTPALPLGVTEHKSWLRNRISRCFFGPIKRPPFNRDELMDEIDYYPDEYLNRLAHEGVNGLWLTIVFRDLCKTSITGLKPDAEKRLEKLRRTVAKCLRYGIKTWAFCIEPAGLLPADPLLEKYPELQGPWGWDKYCFCPSSDTATQYLYESTNWLFKQVPGLGGILNISHGERETTCLSRVSATDNNAAPCPRCGTLPHWQILHRSLSAMQQGMRNASPSAELISWLYMPQSAPLADWVYELPRHTPEGVILQFNFESGGCKNQLGHPRCGGDYWLSYVGPSDHFGRIAAGAVGSGAELGAKIQVGCSHEVASVPFVPVPGLLYRKYKKMRRLGVSNVMQCWYFGNYPGIMNRAAGMLAGENFETSEEDFLLQLARPEWGAAAVAVVKAWQYFAEGYSHYPLSNQFQYYGPMHAGPVWPLYLKPALKPLAPTWKPDFPPSGDTIGECLENHTLEEAMILCRQLSEIWNQGVVLLNSLKPEFNGNHDRLLDIGLAEALGIQFESGYNILKFYHLRKLLYRAKNSLETFGEMEKIVYAEMSRSKRLITLCEQDSRLGFHSEAESHLYYPSRLLWRIEQLRKLLDTEFMEVRQQLEYGRKLESFAPDRQLYLIGDGWNKAGNFRWQTLRRGEKVIFEFECNNMENADYDMVELALLDRDLVEHPWRISFNRDQHSTDNRQSSICRVEKDNHVWRTEIILLTIPGDCYLQIVRKFGKHGAEPELEIWPPPRVHPRHRLNLERFNPENCGRLGLTWTEARMSDIKKHKEVLLRTESKKTGRERLIPVDSIK
jgi:hypothetical protein